MVILIIQNYPPDLKGPLGLDPVRCRRPENLVFVAAVVVVVVDTVAGNETVLLAVVQFGNQFPSYQRLGSNRTLQLV